MNLHSLLITYHILGLLAYIHWTTLKSISLNINIDLHLQYKLFAGRERYSSIQRLFWVREQGGRKLRENDFYIDPSVFG